MLFGTLFRTLFRTFFSMLSRTLFSVCHWFNPQRRRLPYRYRAIPYTASLGGRSQVHTRSPLPSAQDPAPRGGSSRSRLSQQHRAGGTPALQTHLCAYCVPIPTLWPGAHV
jgi:hypothetical protein